jgi:hypothetical protein
MFEERDNAGSFGGLVSFIRSYQGCWRRCLLLCEVCTCYFGAGLQQPVGDLATHCPGVLPKIKRGRRYNTSSSSPVIRHPCMNVWLLNKYTKRSRKNGRPVGGLQLIHRSLIITECMSGGQPDIYICTNRSVAQESLPDEILGRLNATWRFFL